MTYQPTIRAWIDHWPRLHDPRPLVICVRMRGHTTEFRGPPFEHRDWWHSEAGKLHEALTGPHASMLHSGDVAIIHDKCEDYKRVKQWITK